MSVEVKTLAGGKLAGGNPENGRVENDYYATNPEAVKKLLQKYDFFAQTILEPCVGGGHIANAVNDFFVNNIKSTVDSMCNELRVQYEDFSPFAWEDL